MPSHKWSSDISVYLLIEEWSRLRRYLGSVDNKDLNKRKESSTRMIEIQHILASMGVVRFVSDDEPDGSFYLEASIIDTK